MTKRIYIVWLLIWAAVNLSALSAQTTSKASGQSVQQLREEQKKLEKDMALTQKMIKETKRNETATENKLNLLNQSIRQQKKLISNINAEISALDREHESLATQQHSLRSEQRALSNDYARLVRESHYLQMRQRPLLFLLRSESFTQAMRRVRYMHEMADYRRQEVERIVEVQNRIAEKDQELQTNRKEKSKTMARQKMEQEKLARDERKQKQMLKDLKAKEKDLAAKQKRQQRQADEINRKIESLIADQARKQTKDQLTPEQQLLNGGFAANQGRLPWPVEKGTISGHFGRQQHAVYEHVVLDNKGVYLQTTRGAKARAVFDGQVTACLVMGNIYAVIIQHGTYRTVYSGLSQISVKQGDMVKTKQTLGTIFSDPAEDNKTELYFQIYEDKNIRNPELWLTK